MKSEVFDCMFLDKFKSKTNKPTILNRRVEYAK